MGVNLLPQLCSPVATVQTDCTCCQHCKIAACVLWNMTKRSPIFMWIIITNKLSKDPSDETCQNSAGSMKKKSFCLMNATVESFTSQMLVSGINSTCSENILWITTNLTTDEGPEISRLCVFTSYKSTWTCVWMLLVPPAASACAHLHLWYTSVWEGRPINRRQCQY